MNLLSFLVTSFTVLGSISGDGGGTGTGGVEVTGGAEQEEVQQQQCGNGVCRWHNEECGLYMAESTIPNAGWGVFTGIDRNVDDAKLVEPLDLSIPVADYDHEMEFDHKDETMPEWLLRDYHWTAAGYTQTIYEAWHVFMITPGFGMLANSLPRLFNLRDEGCLSRARGPRYDASAGSFTHCQEYAWAPLYDLHAGDELFVNYGEEWFTGREQVLGPIPLQNDYEIVDKMLKNWEELTGNDVTSKEAGDAWETMISGMFPIMKERVRAALPRTHKDAIRALKDPFGSAGTHMPNRSRSLEDLQEHGMCLDHIKTKQSLLVPFQHGAFAARNLKEGQIVAPVPVVPLSRRHLEINVADFKDAAGELLWHGDQLLVNYCFGSRDSSLLLFPYSPGITLINHAGGSIQTEDGKRPAPNVALRWSNRMKAEYLEESVEELLKKQKTGLLMELIALRAIEEGEELLLDYSQDFEDAYQRHLDRWEPPVHAADYKSSWEYEVDSVVYTVDETDKYPSSYITVRCWVDDEQLKEADDEGWYQWVNVEGIGYFHLALPCTVVSADYGDDGEKQSYRVIVEAKEKKIKVKNVPSASITFNEKPYTGNQWLRQAFRHEIRLPDEVFPDAWKDLKTAGTEQCGLYMAASSIPNSGMGMYTAKPINARDRLYSGDVVVQVQDYEENNRLRRIYHNSSGESEDEIWLLDSYRWESAVSLGWFEAETVTSIVPGLGMLANSHSGLVNAEIHAPDPDQTVLHRGKDPGAGASTNYHDWHFWAPQDIVVGEELFVRYGDEFEERTALGMIPLEQDYVDADSLVSRFHLLVTSRGELMSDALVRDLWELVQSALAIQERLFAALPKDVSEMEQVIETGTAKYSTPDRIRSIEWLEKNGLCLDNIRPGDSTIPQAGKGAFATRAIKKGAVIAPLPAVQILRRDLEIYGEKRNPGQNRPEIRYMGQQLLLNYCYGHPESSILLFPYSPVVNYVNHDKSPNAKIQWSSLSRKEWLDRSPVDLARESHAGLVMELVALRDVKEEEEVTLDYGDDWDRAWREFAREWSPEEDSIDYTPASALNRRVEWLRTEAELEDEPYPDNVMTVCFVGNMHRPIRSKGGKTLHREWVYYEGVYHDGNFAYPCDILDREAIDNLDFDDAYDLKDSINPPNIRYTARVRQENGPGTFSNIPRRAIRFFDIAYSSDLSLQTSFRHEIQLPDDMLPQAWRDVEKQQ